MAEDSECDLRRRRSSGNPTLPLNLDGFQINETGISLGTPSPGCVRFTPNTSSASPTSALLEFRKKQQSFEIQVEECEEEEIVVDSEDEAEGDENAIGEADRPVTPVPIQDFAAKVVYTEGPQVTDFLKVKTLEQDCVTDVSEAEGDEE